MDSRPSVKHVLGVLEWFYMLSEKNTFFLQKSSMVFSLPPPPGWQKTIKNTSSFFAAFPYVPANFCNNSSWGYTPLINEAWIPKSNHSKVAPSILSNQLCIPNPAIENVPLLDWVRNKTLDSAEWDISVAMMVGGGDGLPFVVRPKQTKG